MPKAQTFETAIKRLEEITATFENGDIPLEQMLKLFEEGNKLAAFCNARLEQAEQTMKEHRDDDRQDD